MGVSKVIVNNVTKVDLTGDSVTADNLLSGNTAHNNAGNSVSGSITSKSAQTYTPTTTNQTIAAGQYLSGAQTIAGDSNLVSANIASGVSIFGVQGSHTGGTDVSDTTATASDVLDNKYFYTAAGVKTEGTITTQAAASYYSALNGSTMQTIAAGKYLSGAQTIMPYDVHTVTGGGGIAGYINPASIKYGDSMTISHGSGASKVYDYNVAGTFTDSSTVSSGQTAATASQILSGYSAWVDGSEIQGTMTNGLSGCLLLYDNGNEFTDLTGGWSCWTPSGTLTKYSTYMSFTAPSNGTYCYCGPNNAINLTASVGTDTYPIAIFLEGFSSNTNASYRSQLQIMTSKKTDNSSQSGGNLLGNAELSVSQSSYRMYMIDLKDINVSSLGNYIGIMDRSRDTYPMYIKRVWVMYAPTFPES